MNAMEMPDCPFVARNYGVVAADPGPRDSTQEEACPTLIEDAPLWASLRKIVSGFTANPVVHQDLMQEGLIHLWRLEGAKPGQTRSWYLQACQFHVRHWLAAGRSLDSPKRAVADKRVAIDESDSEVALPEYHTNGELFDTVSFRDTIATLATHLKSAEQGVLRGLAEDLTMVEIASKVGISYPTVLKYRSKIAALTIRLGIAEPLSPLKQTEEKTPRSPQTIRRFDAGGAKISMRRLGSCPTMAV